MIIIDKLDNPGLGIVPPVHYIIHDASGNSLVIEYIRWQMYYLSKNKSVFLPMHPLLIGT